MPKPKNKNNREKAVERPLIEVEIELVPRKKRQDTEGVSTDGKPAILIVCEGETEAAYFYGLRECDFFDLNAKFKIEILPYIATKKDNDSEDESDEGGYKGSSVKGLLYMAMKAQKKALVPYYQVWIVTDNDEGNAYKLDDNSLERIKKLVPEHIYDKLKALQIVGMNVQEEEKNKGKNLRKRYFLCYFEYELFLKEYILAPDDLIHLNTIIKNTSKGQDFTNLYNGNRKAFFYDKAGNFIAEKNKKGEEKFNKKYFDQKCLDSIKVAYSSFSFEHWLLLHFEKNNTPFYNSREIIKYFDEKKHFDCNFKKGWYLYAQRDSKVIKDFFNKTTQAINNNMWLNTIMQPQINVGKSFYEVNPYTDVFCLINLLLNQQVTVMGYVNMPISQHKLNDILVSRNAQIISISFTFDRTQSTLKPAIEQLFSIKDDNNNLIQSQIVVHTNQVISTGSKVEIAIPFSKNQDLPLFLCLKEKIKDKEHVVIWVIL